MIQIKYQNIFNRKDDIANKVTHDLLKNDVIVIQDEQLKNWHKSCHSKSIQHSILGRVKSKLLSSDKVVILNKGCPTSKLCSNCGKIHEDLKLWDRTFKCDECGIEEDRDVHAAKNMIWFYEHSVGVGCTNFKPVEIRTSIEEVFNNTSETSCRSAKQEAMNL